MAKKTGRTNIGIIGTRSRDTKEDLKKVEEAFRLIIDALANPWYVTVISGGCPKGGDRFAEVLANHYNVKIEIFYANWAAHGKAAGFIRNTDIARESDILVACVAKDRKGGTEDTISKFRKMKPDGEVVIVE